MVKPSRYIFFFSCCFASLFSLAQNMVLNFGFEEYWDNANAPDFVKARSFYCKNWINAYGYHYSGLSYCVDTSKWTQPEIPLTRQKCGVSANSGSAFIGISVFNANSWIHLQHLTGKLNVPLDSAKEYEFSCYLKYDSQVSQLFLSKVEIAFFNKVNENEDSPLFGTNYQLDIRRKKTLADLTLDISTLQDSLGWIRFSKRFLAKGNENFFCIGLFYQGEEISKKMLSILEHYDSGTSESNKMKKLNRLSKEIPFIKINTDYVKPVNPNQPAQQFGYYYMDDVSIIPLAEN